MKQQKGKLLVIIGPTAVGKTKISIEMAKAIMVKLSAEIPCRFIKGMDIGTAKIKKDEMEGIPHYLIDIKDPDEHFSVAEFQELVRAKIGDIAKQRKLPIIVGGTGLYIQSVIYDYQFSEAPSDVVYRLKLGEKS